MLGTIGTVVAIVTSIISIVPTLIQFVRRLQGSKYSIRFLLISNVLLIVTVVILGVLLGLVSNQKLVEVPPSTNNAPISALTHLMDQDVEAAKTHNVQMVESIYAPEAVVNDDGCYSPLGALTHYNGLVEIVNRYQHLPHFDALQHVDISVTWDPQQPMIAKATSETIGVLSAANSSQRSQPLVGRESWLFERVNNQWYISKFTFNLCLLT